MKQTKILISLFCLMLLGVMSTGCEDPDMDKEFTAYEDYPIGTYLETLPEYSSWVALLKQAHLYDGLNVGTKFTCFVADNNAVDRYFKANNIANIESMDAAQLDLLMRYHIVPDVSYTAVMFNGTLSRATLSGDFLSIKPQSGGMNQIFVNDQVRIVQNNDKRLNGIIHHLDNVLMPVVESLWSLLAEEEYSIFRKGCEVSGLKDYLDNRYKTIGTERLKEYKTVFVVSDSVFKANGITSFEDLVEAYPLSDDESNMNSLQNFMKYHVVTENLDFNKLGTFSSETIEKRKVLQTKAKDQLISIADERGFMIFNRKGEAAQLLKGKYDKQASNGFLHELNNLLPIEEAEQAVVAWEATSYDVFRMLPDYKNFTSDKDHKKYEINREGAEKEGLMWKVIPDNDNAVVYQFRKNQGFLDNDCVTMELGNVGWVEFVIPSIPKGKYQVWIRKIGYNGRGTGYMYFDDNFFVEHNFVNGGYNPNIGTVEFATQSSHRLKIVVKKKGLMEMDQLIFKPIK